MERKRLTDQLYHAHVEFEKAQVAMMAHQDKGPEDEIELVFNQGGIRNLPQWKKEDRKDLAKRVRPSKDFSGRMWVKSRVDGLYLRLATEKLTGPHPEAGWEMV
ncbi:MAG: hypothetical protein JZU65_16060 [Chlorobium sp.]|nr:hypothetical protein [Chlorobium sp.]